MKVEKPIAGTKLMLADQSFGNEGVVVDYSIFRVEIDVEDDSPKPEWFLPFQVCRECLSWIRVAAGQYWLGTLMSWSNSFARGSIVTTQKGITSCENFGASQSANRQPFAWKLRQMPSILGIEAYQAHNERFAKLLCDLYEIRGAAVHRAQATILDENVATGRREKVPVGFSHASQFLFAVDDFLTWTAEKRQQAGLLAPDSFRTPKIPYMIGPAASSPQI